MLEVETLDQTLERWGFGTVEAVKTVSDLFLPLTGEIIALMCFRRNSRKCNSDPYGAGWMVTRISNVEEIETLLSSDS
jgi:glycine cleavage system H protein